MSKKTKVKIEFDLGAEGEISNFRVKHDSYQMRNFEQVGLNVSGQSSEYVVCFAVPPAAQVKEPEPAGFRPDLVGCEIELEQDDCEEQEEEGRKRACFSLNPSRRRLSRAS